MMKGVKIMKGKAFVLVGHENWGKSQTLKSLTDDNRYVKRINLDGRELFIRRMSNDDKPESLVRFVKNLAPQHHSYVILTLCPNFHNSSRKTISILSQLAEKYELFFWVLKFKYEANQTVSDDEIRRLEDYGEVEVFSSKQLQSIERAKEFKSFIKKRI
jgi:hypothetical protein